MISSTIRSGSSGPSRTGHRIKLDIRAGDSVGAGSFTHENRNQRKGENFIYTGGSRASYLELPVIPR